MQLYHFSNMQIESIFLFDSFRIMAHILYLVIQWELSLSVKSCYLLHPTLRPFMYIIKHQFKKSLMVLKSFSNYYEKSIISEEFYDSSHHLDYSPWVAEFCPRKWWSSKQQMIFRSLPMLRLRVKGDFFWGRITTTHQSAYDYAVLSGFFNTLFFFSKHKYSNQHTF